MATTANSDWWIPLGTLLRFCLRPLMTWIPLGLISLEIDQQLDSARDDLLDSARGHAGFR